MSLSTTADYKLYLNRFMYYVEHGRGLDPEGVVRSMGVTQADENQILSEYATYKATLPSRITKTTRVAK